MDLEDLSPWENIIIYVCGVLQSYTTNIIIINYVGILIIVIIFLTLKVH